MFYFISLNLPRRFLRFGVFIKKHACPCIKFRGSTLPQLLVYLILRSFPKIEKFKFASVCVCVCVCVFVCVCVCLHICVYKCDTSKQCYNCYMQNTKHIMFYSSICGEISKFHKLKI